MDPSNAHIYRSGTLDFDWGQDLLNLDGQPFIPTAQITDFASTPINDQNFNTAVVYPGTGTLQLGSLTPIVYSIDFYFTDSLLPGDDDYTAFAVRSDTYDYMFNFYFGPSANDILVPPPTYKNESLLGGHLQVAAADPANNGIYLYVNPSFPVPAIPEPTSLLLLGTGLGVLWLGVNRRRGK